MRRFFSTIMLYAVILIGFSWVYHNNDNARAAVNRIAYVAQANFQQLKSRVTGQKATTTTSAKTQQTSSDPAAIQIRSVVAGRKQRPPSMSAIKTRRCSRPPWMQSPNGMLPEALSSRRPAAEKMPIS